MTANDNSDIRDDNENIRDDNGNAPGNAQGDVARDVEVTTDEVTGVRDADPGDVAQGDVAQGDEVIRAIEAVLMVADEPVSPQLLGELMEVSPALIEERCAALALRYEAERRGFVLVRAAGGYRFQSHPDLATYVERFVVGDQTPRLTGAALETLAIVAYKQPISRAQIAQIRGVNVDGTMKTLVQRGYVAEIGIDPGPGQALLFGTTSLFLANLGLDSLHGLPPLGDLVPGADVMEVLEASLRVDGASGRTMRTDANAVLSASGSGPTDTGSGELDQGDE